MKRTLMLAIALVAMAPLAALASPIYVAGNTCPTDAQMSGYDRQYSVTDAIACVFDPASNNLQGTPDELALYFGAGWTALGQDVGGADATNGFSYTADAGNDDGVFTIGSPLVPAYSQFAIGVKDGGSPKWAIFLLAAGDFESAWHFETNGGDLSHFAIYGRNTLVIDPQCALPQICGGSDDPPTSVPDGGATVAMLGASMGLLGLVRRKLQ